MHGSKYSIQRFHVIRWLWFRLSLGYQRNISRNLKGDNTNDVKSINKLKTKSSGNRCRWSMKNWEAFILTVNWENAADKREKIIIKWIGSVTDDIQTSGAELLIDL